MKHYRSNDAGRVFGYGRVSTPLQSAHGESLKTQEVRVTGYAQMQGLAIEHFFAEQGVSGSVPLSKRSEGRDLLGVIKPGDTVIATKLDRMFRSAIDALGSLEDFKKRGVSLHLIDLGGDCTGNGVAKLVFQILAAVAEAERERISERILEVKRRQRAEGLFVGGRVPFGWSLRDSELVVNSSQQHALRQMRRMKRAGLSLRAISKALHEKYDMSLSHSAVGVILAGSRVVDSKGYVPRLREPQNIRTT